MNALQSQYESQGFQALGFPANEFHYLEPYDTPSELMNGLKYVRPGGGFVPNFQLFKKISTNGDKEHPLYTYMKKYCGPTSDTFESGLFYSPLKVSDVRWNYEVFLISKQGYPIFRYAPETDIKTALKPDIEQLLKMAEEMSNEIPELEVEEMEEVETPEEEMEPEVKQREDNVTPFVEAMPNPN